MLLWRCSFISLTVYRFSLCEPMMGLSATYSNLNNHIKKEPNCPLVHHPKLCILMEWLHLASDGRWCFGQTRPNQPKWKTTIVQWVSHPKWSFVRFYCTRVKFRWITTFAIKRGKSFWTKGSGWADDLRRFADEELIPDKDCEVLRYPGALKPTQRLEVTAPQAARDHENRARICCVRAVQVLWCVDCGFEFIPVPLASCRLHLHSTNGYSSYSVGSLYWRAKAPLMKRTTTWSFGWCFRMDISLDSWVPECGTSTDGLKSQIKSPQLLTWMERYIRSGGLAFRVVSNCGIPQNPNHVLMSPFEIVWNDAFPPTLRQPISQWGCQARSWPEAPKKSHA